MSLLNYFKKVKKQTDRSQDLTIEDTFVLTFCEQTNTLSIKQIKDLGVGISYVLELSQKDLPFSFNNNSYHFLFTGDRRSVEEKYNYYLEKAKTIQGTEDLEQNPKITSSQEAPGIDVTMDKDLIISKLDQIKKLVNEIELIVGKNEPMETPIIEPEDLSDESSQSLPATSVSQDLSVKDKEISLKKGLIKKFEEILYRKRFGKDGWTRMVNNFFLPNVQHDKMQGIQKVLTSGSKLHGYVVREIAKLLFGIERLKITKMMNPKSRSYSLKAGDRKKLFSKKDEEDLKSILNLIDKDLFASKDGWYYLVVLPINQCGLDVKRDEKKREIEKLRRKEKKKQKFKS